MQASVNPIDFPIRISLQGFAHGANPTLLNVANRNYKSLFVPTGQEAHSLLMTTDIASLTGWKIKRFNIVPHKTSRLSLIVECYRRSVESPLGDAAIEKNNFSISLIKELSPYIWQQLKKETTYL